MGNWAIVIHGVGCHHNNGMEQDANRMSARFVQQLRDAGHTVQDARFTSGCEDAIVAGKAYLETRDEIEASEAQRRGIMMPAKDPDAKARKAYAAYGDSTGGKNFQGNPMPTFDALPDAIKAAWRAACAAVAG